MAPRRLCRSPSPAGRPRSCDKKSATRALERIASAEFDDLRRIILEFANPHAVTMAKYANFEQYAEEAGL